MPIRQTTASVNMPRKQRAAYVKKVTNRARFNNNGLNSNELAFI